MLAGAAGFEPANAGTKTKQSLIPRHLKLNRKPQKSADFWLLAAPSQTIKKKS
jgi:hypothetical protein